MIHGTAMQRIKIGASVIFRGNRVWLAGPEIANGVAVKSIWGRRDYQPGSWVTIQPVEGLGPRDLHAMANAPLMDANRIYLPAGKVSEVEYQQRVSEDFRRAGIDE